MSSDIDECAGEIAVLMQFVITPKDATTAHVNHDIRGIEIIAKVS